MYPRMAVTKRNELLINTTASVALENILSERSQIQKYTYDMIPFISSSKTCKNESMGIEIRIEISSIFRYGRD